MAGGAVSKCLHTCAAVAVAAVGALAQTMAPHGTVISAVTMPVVVWVRPSAADVALLNDRWPEIDEELKLFGYSPMQWTSTELNQPPFHSHKVFRLASPAPAEDVVTVIVPESPAQDIAVIPILQDGQGRADTPADPHNLAIFNQAMSEEPASSAASGPGPAATPAQSGTDSTADGETNWLLVARDYLEMTGDNVDILDAHNMKAALGQVPLEQFSPVLSFDGRGSVSVQFCDYHGADDIVEWFFDFDAAGWIRGLDRHAGSKSELLRYTRGRP